ncbi:hypothetical protein H0H87_009547 [Tephrocybe sp. NHM501043]|nr:hypothetical protein H0H87_009547 [Tephrocybe sp. NHM501043]
MPSFRSICLIAATAFVAFATASPIAGGVTQDASLIDVTDVANGIAHNVDVKDVDLTVVDLDGHHSREVVEARGQVTSLPDILKNAHTALVTVKADTGGKNVPVETVRPCLDKVHAILADVLVQVKLLQGKPLSVIIGVVAVVDVATLLCAVLTIVVEILVALIGCAGVNAHLVIDIIVATISVVLCDVLSLVLSLVAGLLVLLLPLLAGVISLLTGCGLEAVLKILLVIKL